MTERAPILPLALPKNALIAHPSVVARIVERMAKSEDRVGSLWGIDIVTDNSLPPGEARLCDANGKIVRVFNIGTEEPK